VSHQNSIVNALVEGRECGSCTVCCDKPTINDENIQKPGNVRCMNIITGGGCRIYGDRPRVCSEFFCVWRAADYLDDTFRPDKSGLLITSTDQNIPEGYEKAAMIFNPVYNAEVLMIPPILGMIADMILINKIPVFISIGFEENVDVEARFLNDKLIVVKGASPLSAITPLMRQLIDSCLKNLRENPKPQNMKHVVG
jgi:hypothetical protein